MRLNGWGLALSIESANDGGLRYPNLNMPLPGNDDHADASRRTVTAFADLQLRGLKGLNIYGTNVQPNNLSRMEAVPQGATSFSVSLAPTIEAAQFAQCMPQNGASSLAAGAYYYAATRIGSRGETGISELGGASHRQVRVASGQRVVLQSFGGDGNRYKARFYRARTAGMWDG